MQGDTASGSLPPLQLREEIESSNALLHLDPTDDEINCIKEQTKEVRSPSSSSSSSEASVGTPEEPRSVPVAPTAPPAPFPIRPAASEPRVDKVPPTMGLGDILSIIGAAISTIMVLQSKPTDSWFNPAQSLDSCVCSGAGETLLCPCLPIVFLIYQAWAAIFFCTFLWLLVRVLVRHGFRWVVPFYMGTMLPAYGWTIYQAIPRQFRKMVMWMDSGLLVATSVVVFLVWCFYGCRRTSSTVPV